MDKGLKELSLLPGVGGAFVCDNRGGVIVSSTPAALATATMNTIGREVAQAFTAAEKAGWPSTRVEFVYDTWRLLAEDLGGAVLFLVCEEEADMPIARMTVDVVAAAWRKDSGVKKQLARHWAARTDVMTTANFDEVSRRSWRIIESRA
ncbi:MAG: hypothetical protein ACRDG3_12420 [Tepidiformaceae bacterium]